MPSYGVVNAISPSNAAWTDFTGTHATEFDAMQSAWSALSPTGPVSGMQTAFDTYQAAIEAAFTSLSGIFGGAFDTANDFFSGAFESFQDILGGGGLVSDGLAALGGTAANPTGEVGAVLGLGLAAGQASANANNNKADNLGYPAQLVALTGGGAPMEYASVNYVEQGLGIKPGIASVTIHNVVSRDESGGTYILSGGGQISEIVLKYWSRWAIKWRGTQMFNGALMSRREDIENQCVHLTFVDDRTLLEKIRLRGALVYDRVAGAVKFVTRYNPHVNPGGMRNCTKVQLNGIAGAVYVFSEMAEQAALGISPYNKIGDEGQVRAGDAIFWTPERWLNYVRLYCLYALDALPDNTFQGSMPKLNTNKLDWPYFGFSDAAQLTNHKLPDINFRGQSAMFGVIKGLDQTGEFDLNVKYGNNGKTTMFFSPLTAENNFAAGNVSSLDLQTTGRIKDGRTIYAGGIDNDASELATVSVAEGKPVAVESQFGYIDALDSIFAIEAGSSFISTLYPAWTAAEELAFLTMIWKGLDKEGNRLKFSDGTNIPLASEVLLHKARQAFPKVFRAYEIRSDNIAGIMAGHDSKYLAFDYIKGHRSMLDEQLQPYFEQDAEGKVARGRLRLPIRVQVSDLKASDAAGTYQEVPFNNGIRFDDGLIWFDGLTDDINPLYNVYTGNLCEGQADKNPADRTADNYPKLRNILLNMAVELDIRCFNYSALNGYDPNLVKQHIDASVIPYTTAGTDILQDYMLNPDGFREEHQKESRPCDATMIAAQKENDPTQSEPLTLPVDKILHSDDDELLRTSKRRLRRLGRIKKRFEFKLPGVRPDLHPGMFITDVVLRPAGGKYPLNSPVQRVRYDFDKQHTVLAGQDVISEVAGE